MLSVQILTTLCLTAASVLAPSVAPTLGIEPSRIGTFVGLAYFFAMLSGLRCGVWVERFGPIRLSQLALLMVALGSVMATVLGAGLLLVAAALIGAGYGMSNPAAAVVLNRHVPGGSTGLFFSMKQAGVPIGVAVAGLVMPLGLHAVGWQISAWLAAGVALTAIVLLECVKRPLDDHAARRAAATAALGTSPIPSASQSILAPLVEVWLAPSLRRLALLSLIYASTQMAFVTFLVSLLKLEAGYSLTVAAGILSASQVVSTLARVGFGHVADRWIAPGRLLGLLGLAMGVSCLALGHFSGTGGFTLTVISVMACSATAMGWNGVYFAQLVREVPAQKLAATSGAAQFFTFCGGMSGPFLFGQFLQWGGTYTQGYLVLAVLPALTGLAMLNAQRSATAAPIG